jgi:ABC-type microcin C transport system permease subunit YejE
MGRAFGLNWDEWPVFDIPFYCTPPSQRNHLGIDERGLHLHALSGTKLVSIFGLVLRIFLSWGCCCQPVLTALS